MIKGEDTSLEAKKNLWDDFWSNYFLKYWFLSNDFIAKWNVIGGIEMDLNNRTNNSLERYNLTINDKLLTPHPRIAAFIKVIEEESRMQVGRLNDIRMNKISVRKSYKDNDVSIPSFYSDFNYDVPKGKGKGKGRGRGRRIWSHMRFECIQLL